MPFERFEQQQKLGKRASFEPPAERSRATTPDYGASGSGPAARERTRSASNGAQPAAQRSSYAGSASYQPHYSLPQSVTRVPSMPQPALPSENFSSMLRDQHASFFADDAPPMTPPSRPNSANAPRRSSVYAPVTHYYPPSPTSPDLPPSPRNETSPMLPQGSRDSYFSQGAFTLSHSTLYTLPDRSSGDLRQKEGWTEKSNYSARPAQMPRLAAGRADRAQKARQRKRWLFILAALLVAAIAIVVAVMLVKKSHTTSSPSATSPSDNGAGNPAATTAAPAATPSVAPIAMWGASGSTVTRDDGSNFTYTSSFGGAWCAVPFNDTAQAQSDVPPLDQPWDFQQNFIQGVNLGGWLTLEPFITPALYEPYENTTNPAVDEYTLSTNLGTQMQATITNHYQTFITEDDFYQIATAGLNWVRIGLPFWAIETIQGEPFLEGVAWTYFLQGVKWARKYGIRINLDFHAVPGSQNGWNHSGKLGPVGFMHNPVGIVNAQRTLNYIRTLAEFISQPEYSNVIGMFSFINEPLVATIGQDQMKAFYYEVYNMVRGITGTGVGKGPYLSFHDAFMGQQSWYGFMAGADRLALDTHPYLAFGNGVSNPIATDITTPCTGWNLNASMNNFGFTMAGEFSLAVNDCGEYVNGVGSGTRYEGTYMGNNQRYGSCDTWTNYQAWTPQMKTQLQAFGMGQMDSLRNWFFWTWKIGNSTKTGLPPNPMWDYSLGLQQGYIPANPRSAVGACASLVQQYNAGQVTPTPVSMPAWATGGAGAGNLHDTGSTSYNVFPPPGMGNVNSGVRYSPTGGPLTMPTPTYAGGSTAGNGWFAAADQGNWYVPTAAQGYPSPYATHM